jgi:hypothetical protein
MLRYSVQKNLTGAIVVSFIGGEEGSEVFLILCPGLGIDTITHTRAFDSAFDQAGSLQLFQVLGNSGLGQAKFVNQVSTDTGVAPDEVLNDGDPGRVSQSLHHGGELILLVGEYFGFG